MCRRSNDPRGNTACFCEDISVFSVKSLLGRLYSESNLHLLTLENMRKIFSKAIFSQWSFWVVIVSLFWFVLTLIVVKTCNKDYCLAKTLRKQKIKTLKRSCLNQFFLYILVIHPLLSIFFYTGRYARSKALRALIYFVRVMTLLGTLAVFMKNPENIEVINIDKLSITLFSLHRHQ